MSLNLIDIIMKKIELHYKGKISMDSEYCHKYSSIYNGYNGYFSSVNSKHSDNCFISEDSKLIIPNSGTIYGPYYKLLPGKYRIVFQIESGPGAIFSIDVFSRETGTLTTKTIEGTGEECTLTFELGSILNNAEFRVINLGDIPIAFWSLELSVENVEEMKHAVDQYINNESEAEQESIGLAVQFVREHIAVAEKSCNCTLPDDTKWHLVKRVIRRIIQVYSRFQIEFNQHLVHICKNILDITCKTSQSVSHLSTQMMVIRDGQEARVNKIEEICVNNKNVIIEIQGLLNTYEEQAARAQDQIARLQEHVGARDNDTKQIQEGMARIQRALMTCDEYTIMHIQKQQENFEKFFDDIWSSLDVRNHQADALQKQVEILERYFKEQWEENGALHQEIRDYGKVYHDLRQELFYELDYRIRKENISTSHETVKSKTKESAILKENRYGRKLNIGSGMKPLENYINVDARELSSVDVVAEAGQLPYSDNSVDEIYSAHLIEHFPKRVLESEILPHWYLKLKAGGHVVLIFPDFEEMLAAYGRKEMSFEDLAEVVMGGQDYALDYHYAVLSTKIVEQALAAVGFSDIKVVKAGRRNGLCYETEIHAVK